MSIVSEVVQTIHPNGVDASLYQTCPSDEPKAFIGFNQHELLEVIRGLYSLGFSDSADFLRSIYMAEFNNDLEGME